MLPSHFSKLLPALALFLALGLGCSSSPPILVPPGSGSAPASGENRDTIVVLVPGITGVQLRVRDTGELLWGDGKRLFSPRDGGARLAIPIGSPSQDDTVRVEAFAPLREIHLLGLRKPIYGPILDLLARDRQFGDLGAPTPEASLFSFSYDWRQDNVDSARLLADQLARVRALRPGKSLAVNLICQSNGAHICRYLAKYGGASLDDAEAGTAQPPAGIDIQKIILIGTANGGSLRILREMNRGRRYVAPFGRILLPEVLFTFPSLYQELPSYRSRFFVDGEGRELEVDLYDPASWKRYGWSIYGKKAHERLQSAPAALDGTPQRRDEILERNLDRTRRFQALLHQDAPGFPSPRYYMIQNAFEETPDRAMLVQEGGTWKTYFSGDRRLEKGYLFSVTTAPGDGHAAVSSQEWLSPQELDAIATEPHIVPDTHFEMILHPSAQRRLLEFLAD